MSHNVLLHSTGFPQWETVHDRDICAVKVEAAEHLFDFIRVYSKELTYVTVPV